MRWFVALLLVLVVGVVWLLAATVDDALALAPFSSASPGAIACPFAGVVIAFILAVGIGKLFARD